MTNKECLDAAALANLVISESCGSRRNTRNGIMNPGSPIKPQNHMPSSGSAGSHPGGKPGVATNPNFKPQNNMPSSGSSGSSGNRPVNTGGTVQQPPPQKPSSQKPSTGQNPCPIGSFCDPNFQKPSAGQNPCPIGSFCDPRFEDKKNPQNPPTRPDNNRWQ